MRTYEIDIYNDELLKTIWEHNEIDIYNDELLKTIWELMTKIRRMGEGTLLIIDKPPSPLPFFFLKSLFHIFKVRLKFIFKRFVKLLEQIT
jgi:hypothetical protein